MAHFHQQFGTLQYNMQLPHLLFHIVNGVNGPKPYRSIPYFGILPLRWLAQWSRTKMVELDSLQNFNWRVTENNIFLMTPIVTIQHRSCLYRILLAVETQARSGFAILNLTVLHCTALNHTEMNHYCTSESTFYFSVISFQKQRNFTEFLQ